MPNHGKQDVRIDRVEMQETGNGKVVVNVGCLTMPEEEAVTARIYITEAAANMAHKALKICGFDTDTQNLQKLLDDPECLKGNVIPVDIFDDPPYGMKCEIVLVKPPAQKTVKALDAMLKGRAVATKRAQAEVAAPIPADDIPF